MLMLTDFVAIERLEQRNDALQKEVQGLRQDLDLIKQFVVNLDKKESGMNVMCL